MTFLQLAQFVPQHIEMAVDRCVTGVSPWLLFFNTLYTFLAAIDLLLTSPFHFSFKPFSIYQSVIDAQPHVQMIGSFLLSFGMWFWFLRFYKPPQPKHLSDTETTYSAIQDPHTTSSSFSHSYSPLGVNEATSLFENEQRALDVHNRQSELAEPSGELCNALAPSLHMKEEVTESKVEPVHVFYGMMLIMVCVVIVSVCLRWTSSESIALFAYTCGVLSVVLNTMMWIPQVRLTLTYGHRGALSLQWVVASFVMDVIYSTYLAAMHIHWSVWANNVPDAIFTATLAILMAFFDWVDRTHGRDGFGRTLNDTSELSATASMCQEDV